MAKIIESLIASRENRAKLLAEHGETPTSILRYDKKMMALDLIVENGRSYRSSGNTGGHTGKLADVFDVSSQCVREGALSRFPQNVGRTLLLLYTKTGELVLDPFAGHNSRLELCFRASRRYYGNDISAKFQEANRQVLKLLRDERETDLFAEQEPAPDVQLTTGDSRHLPWDNGIGDFTITSPPYYCLEHYGDEPEQLGNGARSYHDFLDRLFLVMQENWRVLKAGRVCIWCVNDFRYDGKFYSYHSDVIKLMTRSGFVQRDIAIVDLGPSIASAFVNQVFERKLLPKCHEYALIFEKPR